MILFAKEKELICISFLMMYVWFIIAGNLVVLKPTEDDAGLYQCVASNSEGVVFSRVIQVQTVHVIYSGFRKLWIIDFVEWKKL